MSFVRTSGSEGAHRRNDRLRAAVRDIRVQLSVLNHRVAARAGVKDVDFDCLDLISIHGPISPGGLAKIAGLHPATLTGILDRLETQGWVRRERDVSDRRSVVVRVLPDRNAEVFALYAGMNARFDEICANYDDAQLDTIAAFLEQVRQAGTAATDELAER